MTPEQEERYYKRSRELMTEINHLVAKYTTLDEDIAFQIVIGALNSEMVHFLHSYVGSLEDRIQSLERSHASMRVGLNQTQTLEDLKKMTLESP